MEDFLIYPRDEFGFGGARKEAPLAELETVLVNIDDDSSSFDIAHCS